MSGAGAAELEELAREQDLDELCASARRFRLDGRLRAWLGALGDADEG